MNKSKKDMAFEKERAKYRKQIRELEVRLEKKDLEIFKENKRACEAEAKCAELQEWIDRLLEYTETSEEDMKIIIKKEKDTAEIMERVNDLFGITQKFGLGGYF